MIILQSLRERQSRPPEYGFMPSDTVETSEGAFMLP